MTALEQEIRDGGHKLNTMRSSRNNMISRNRVLASLKEAQDNGVLSGVFGRLGDLGTIDQDMLISQLVKEIKDRSLTHS